MPILTVTAVTNVNEFASQHGPLLGWNLNVTHPDGRPEAISINSKLNRTYKVGESFDAERTGQEYKGVFRYKRVQAPQGPQGNGQGFATSQPAQAPQKAPSAQAGGFSLGGGTRPAPMAYDKALDLLRICTENWGNDGGGSTLFEAILRGEVVSPIKPRTTVVYFGNTLETAGVDQPTWDQIDALCNDLTKETDAKNVKALLIASAGVVTRKDLTMEKAREFIEALRVNIAAVKPPTPPAPFDSDPEIPF